MKITIYTDSDVTGSTYIMAVDLSDVLVGMGHEVAICTVIGHIGETKPDLLLNFIPKDIIRLQKQAGRYFYCGGMVTVFTPGLSIFSVPEVGYMLLSALETPIVSHSYAINQDLVNRVRKLFSPAIQRRILDNLMLIPYGVGAAYTFKKKSGKSLRNFVAPFTRAVEDHKRFSVHQQVTLKTSTLLKLKGFDMVTAFYASSPKLSHTDSKDMTGYDVRPIVLGRQEYAKELEQFAFSISTSDYESFGLYYVELLMSGVIVVFSDYPWVRQLLPNYRFVSPDKDLPAMVAYVRENYDVCFEYLEVEVLPVLREKYLLSAFASTLLEKVSK